MIVFRIKQIRESQNISAYKLSKITNISRSYLSKLENNIFFNPTFETLNKIANALDVNIKELFYTTLDIDDLKEEMYRRIDEFGLNSKEVLEVSQVIDLLIVIKMKEEQN